MSRNLYVIPYGDKWAIEEDDSDIKIVHNTMEDAIREARKMARDKKAVMLIRDSSSPTEE